jgi:phospholipid/cholesterol/gamma-HCH transport system substrate-binding protein
METRANFVLIGVAALAGATLALLFAMWIAGARFNQAYAQYIVAFDGPVRGLAKGGEVRFQGIKVGEVVDLRIDPEEPSKVLARVRIDAATPVRKDSIGQLEPIGLTGVNLIQIAGGGKESPILRQQLGQPTPRINGEQSEIDKLLGAGGDIAQQASQALMAIQNVLTDENAARISRIIADLESVSDTLQKERSLISEARGAAANFRKAAASIDGLATDARSELSIVGERGDAALTAIAAAAEKSQSALVQAEQAAAIAAEQSLPDIAIAAQDLRRLSITLDSLAYQLERQPNRLIVGEERPTVKVRP